MLQTITKKFCKSIKKDMQKEIKIQYSTSFLQKNIGKLPPPTDEELKAREELALCHRICDWLKLNEGVDNHLTYALSCNTKFLISTYGIPWNRMTASNLLLVDLDGNVIRGEGVPQLAGFTIHSSIHRMLGYKRAKVIFHTHQPYTTALSCIEGEGGKILNIHQNSCRFHESIVYDNNYRGVVETKEEGERLANLLLTSNKNRILMMGSHGISTIAGNAAEAMTDLYYLEALSKVQSLALSNVGGDAKKLRYIRPEIVEFTYNQFRSEPEYFANMLLNGWRKTMEIYHPDYKH